MKKKLLSLFLFLFVFQLYSEESLKNIIDNNTFHITLLNETNKYAGEFYFENGQISANYGRSYIVFEYCKHEIINNDLYITYKTARFSLKGTPPFRDYTFPEFFQIKITYNQIKNAIENKGNGEIKDVSKKINNPSIDGIVICDNLRIREKPDTKNSTKVIGKLKKWDKITIIDCTTTKTTIANLEYPWYKIKLKDGTEGWIFGGFAKIYFWTEDLDLLYKTFEKENSEYSNQFITPNVEE